MVSDSVLHNRSNAVLLLFFSPSAFDISSSFALSRSSFVFISASCFCRVSQAASKAFRSFSAFSILWLSSMHSFSFVRTSFSRSPSNSFCRSSHSVFLLAHFSRATASAFCASASAFSRAGRWLRSFAISAFPVSTLFCVEIIVCRVERSFAALSNTSFCSSVIVCSQSAILFSSCWSFSTCVSMYRMPDNSRRNCVFSVSMCSVVCVMVRSCDCLSAYSWRIAMVACHCSTNSFSALNS